MSTKSIPKQLIPFIDGRSLIEIALDRIEPVVGMANCYLCAAESQRDAILGLTPGLTDSHYIGEPTGRDTLAAIALSAAVVQNNDPDALLGVFTADHVISPEPEFRRLVEAGYEAAGDNMIVTFGIEPTRAATGYGYLRLGTELGHGLRVVEQFQEKPDSETAERYFRAGAARYLWNSGMFVFRTDVFLDCVKQFTPDLGAAIKSIARSWEKAERNKLLDEIYPSLDKISVDYAIMEPASESSDITIAAVPMRLDWRDVGSWPEYGKTLEKDSDQNATNGRALFVDSKGTVAVADEPGHLVVTVGCDDLLIINTGKATLVCNARDAEKIKEVRDTVGERFGEEYL